MESVFEKIWRLSPAAFVLKAIVIAVVANALLLAFILLRRTRRKRYFAKRDGRVFELRPNSFRVLAKKAFRPADCGNDCAGCVRSRRARGVCTPAEVSARQRAD